jgi:hypothetical protein
LLLLRLLLLLQLLLQLLLLLWVLLLLLLLLLLPLLLLVLDRHGNTDYFPVISTQGGRCRRSLSRQRCLLCVHRHNTLISWTWWCLSVQLSFEKLVFQLRFSAEALLSGTKYGNV